MRKLIPALRVNVACLSLYLLAVAPALAADVTIPYGDWIKAATDILGVAIWPALAAWLAKLVGNSHLPAALITLIKTLLADQLLGKAVAWGLNSVAGATAGKRLSVHIANQVVAEAVQYAVDHGP